MPVFEGKRYVTRGIWRLLDLELQAYLWRTVETFRASGAEMDYLQIFDLELVTQEGRLIQKIIHRQECPQYRQEYLLWVLRPVEARVFVIDGKDHVTMLLTREY